MDKMFKAAVALIVLTQVFSFAQESEGGGFKVGFYGSIAGGGTGEIGPLLDIGNNLELGLGIGITKSSQTRETTNNPKEEVTDFEWRIIPSVSFEIGKKDIISYGAGLSIRLSSSSRDRTTGGETVTTEGNMNMAFFPNFFLKAEAVKNFVVGLKTGLFIDMPGDEENGSTTISRSYINTRTEVFVAFYL